MCLLEWDFYATAWVSVWTQQEAYQTSLRWSFWSCYLVVCCHKHTPIWASCFQHSVFLREYSQQSHFCYSLVYLIEWQNFYCLGSRNLDLWVRLDQESGLRQREAKSSWLVAESCQDLKTKLLLFDSWLQNLVFCPFLETAFEILVAYSRSCPPLSKERNFSYLRLFLHSLACSTI